MERIWLKQYPAGVPADIDVNQYSSLVELLEESFKKFADRKAFICMDKSISYRDLDEMSAALGAYLQSKGMQKGARVALMMPNVLQYPIAIFGRISFVIAGELAVIPNGSSSRTRIDSANGRLSKASIKNPRML